MTRMTATAEVSAIGQIVLNSSNRLLASSFNMLTVAKFVRTSVATAADTIGGPTLREYLKEPRLPRETEEVPSHQLINCPPGDRLRQRRLALHAPRSAGRKRIPTKTRGGC